LEEESKWIHQKKRRPLRKNRVLKSNVCLNARNAVKKASEGSAVLRKTTHLRIAATVAAIPGNSN
jgi:hypothetical protein